LSGGLDSSVIVSLVNKQLKERSNGGLQEVVSACFKDKNIDEQKFIDIITKEKGIKTNKIFPNAEEFFENIDQFIYENDEPVRGSGVFAQRKVFEEAKNNNLKVMLDGQGADEQLIGYFEFYSNYYGELINKFKFITLFREISKHKKYQKLSNLAIAKGIINTILPLSTKQAVRNIIGYGRPKWINKEYSQIDPHIKYGHYSSSLYKSSMSQLFYTNLPILLHSEDRNSMYNSIEARVPFLDYRVVEYITSLPNHYKIFEGKSKYILRESMKNILPIEIFNRTDKKGFATPEEMWIYDYSQLIREELDELFTNLKKIDFFNKKEFDIFLNNSLNNKELNKIDSRKIYRLFTFSRWLKIFAVSIN
jgi:asparagine synthase (glutamine-hydrolysing)